MRYVLHAVLMAHPEQASSLQGSHSVGCGDLAANDLGSSQAGNRAWKTRRHLQCWECEPEQSAVILCLAKLMRLHSFEYV